MPEGIEYIRGSSRLDELRNLRCTDFIDEAGARFMREVGPESDVWLLLLPEWYECWPSRLARFMKSAFSTEK